MLERFTVGDVESCDWCHYSDRDAAYVLPTAPNAEVRAWLGAFSFGARASV